jgi:hypothetical protein
MQSPDTSQRWVPFDEACRILGRTPTTLRREIKAGRVVAEVLPRNPDNPADSRTVYRVRVDLPPEDAPTPTTAPESPSATEAATEPPAATTRLLDKLDERDETIRAKDAAIERLHGELRDATARASTAEAEAAAAERRAADLAERLAGVERERDALRARRWWRFW